MLVEVKVPVLAESVPDATLLDWLKQEGDAVQRGENLIDLETDKVTLEIAAPETGVIKSIEKQTGDVVLTDEILAIIDTEGVATGDATSATASNEQPAAAPPPQDDGAEVKFGPAVRKLLDENNLNANDVPATGKGGRLTKADVLAYLENPPAPAVPAASGNVQERPLEPVAARSEERVPMTRLRKRAAERLLMAQHENALLTTFNEVNMGPVMALRSRLKDDFEKRYGVRLGFMSFFVKAAVEALKLFPIVNASVDGEDIIYHGYFDVGVAVSSDRGLVVPILRDVDAMSFSDVERQIRDFGERARDGKLTIDELTGGTFTSGKCAARGSW
ncbi:MAG: 2-oxo acid dehydrogenase subunit E2 [Pseudomonadota bacterium]